MSATIQRTGKCLCGAVEVQARNVDQGVGACHCSMCSSWTGGPFMTVDCGSDVSFTGEEHIGTFDSSPWAERGFCRQCGSHLFYRIKESQQHMMPVGLFENTEGLAFDHQVFIDEKPAYYDFSNKTKNMTGAEVFAMYAPPES